MQRTLVAAALIAALGLLSSGSGSGSGIGAVGVSAAGVPAAQRDFMMSLLANIQWKPGQVAPQGWNNSDPCLMQWTGVSCDSRDTTIYTISLQGLTTLISSIPSNIDAMTDLNYLNLNTCGLRGPLPKQIASLSNLRALDLGQQNIPGAAPGSGMTGSIPAEIGSMRYLNVLVLANNRLSGPIPAEVKGMLNLVTFDVGNNQLTGELPPLWGSVNSLFILNVQNNAQLTGNLTWLGHCQNLQFVRLAQNAFDGDLGWIAALRGLSTLDLRSNQFHTLPTDFSNHPGMLFMDLSNNNFRQNLPDLPLPKLQALFLSGNAFTGTVPVSYVLNLTSVTQMDLSSNLLTALPDIAAGQLSQMQCLWLGSNPWTPGTQLPAALSNMTQLDTLEWSKSSLTGPVPELPPSLRSLDLSMNSLSGGFPLSLLHMPFLGLAGVGCGAYDLQAPTPTLVLKLHDNAFTGELPQPAFTSRDSVRSQWQYLDVAQIDLSQNLWANAPAWCAVPGGLCSRRADNSPDPSGGFLGYNKWPVLFQGLLLGGGAVFIIGLITLCVCLRRRHQQRKNNAHSMGYVSAPAGGKEEDVVHPDIASLAGDINADVTPGEPLASPVMNPGSGGHSGMSSPGSGSGHNSPMLGARALNRGDAPLIGDSASAMI